MSFFELLFRGFRLIFFPSAALAGLGYVFFGPTGAVAMGAVWWVVLVAEAVRAEGALARIYGARVRRTPSPQAAWLRASLKRAVDPEGLRRRPLPRVEIFPDPSPLALVTRSVGGRGTILMSQGLLASLHETELRQFLRTAELACRSRGLSLRTLSARLAHAVFSLAPRAWLSLFLGSANDQPRAHGPLSFLRFIAVRTAAFFFVRLSRGHSVPPMAPEYAAVRRILSQGLLSSRMLNPGTSQLHFHDPWSRRSAFP